MPESSSENQSANGSEERFTEISDIDICIYIYI